jgi:flagellar hook-associated protein 2
MSTSSSSIFTGSSQFSTSLAQVIQKAVAAASLPITTLSSHQAELNSQSDEVTTLASKFTALQNAITGLNTAANSSFGATVSDPASISASVGAGAAEGHYSIEVTSAGTKSTMMTSAWNAASGDPITYHLWIGDQDYEVTGSDNSAASVAQAINAQYGNLVSATAVNVGSSASPDYRISLQAKKLSSDALDMKSGGVSLAAIQHNGQPAQYQVNGSGNVVSSDSASISIADGVNLTLLAASSGAVTVNVTRSTSTLASALSTFVSAYNAAVTELAGQRGQSGGVLQGQSVISQLSRALGRMATFSSNTGTVAGLRSLGITLGNDGKLTVDYSKLQLKDLFDSGSVNAFLGSAPDATDRTKTGSGFLKSASDVLKSIADSSSGLLPALQTSLKSQMATTAAAITTRQAQVTRMQDRLINQMALNDATIATMEQKFSFLNAMFEATQTSSRQYS